MPCGLVYPIVVVVWQNREMNEEYDEDCVEKGFQLAWVKLYKNVEEGREALGMSNRSINI